MTVDVRRLPGTALTWWLRGARLPLTVAEAVLKREEDTSSWPPSVAFGKLEATAKEALGRVTGDQALVAEANLLRAEAQARQEAVAKAQQAQEVRAEAARTASLRTKELTEQRQEVADRADARAAQRAEAAAEAEQQVAKKAAAAKAAARTAAQAAARATDRAEKQAEQRLLREEAAALRAKEQAVEAKRDVLELDAAVRAKKARRQAG